MPQKCKKFSFLNRQCAAMLAEPIMGLDAIFSFGAFFHVGREGLLLDKYHVELLLIVCIAWFDKKRRWLEKLK